MIWKTRLRAAAAACCLALALAACGGGDPAAPVSASGQPVTGGTGRVLMLAEPSSLDPAAMGNAYAVSAVLGNALYGTLLTNDPETGEVRYSMAESFTTNDGGASFELKLRPGLVFSDGTPLDAAAVKFNWDRTKDPATGSVSRYEASLIASSEVVDERTLVLTMAAPGPNYAQSVLSTTMNWIASPAALQAGRQAFDAHPVGAGPFVLESWVRQGDITLVRNPRFWAAPKPYLDRLSIRTSTDANQRLNALISGGADVAIDSNWWNLAKATDAGLISNVMSPSGGLFMAMNSRRAPFDDVRARQAVSAALDLEALDSAVYAGHGQAADTLFSQTSPFHSDTPLRTPDRALAQRLFDELAAEGKPVRFTFTSFPSSENRAIAEAVQSQLATFTDVEVQIRVVDIAQASAVRSTYDFDVLLSSAFFVDPEPRLWTVFHSSSGQNLSGVADPELDAALQTGRAAATAEERASAYEVVEQRLVALAPVIFLERVGMMSLAGKNVGGMVQYGFGSLLPEDLWIDS